jgi:heptosyltransferase III
MCSSPPPILIVHQGALGDLLLSLPALLSLRRYHRRSPWTLAGNPANQSLLRRRLQVRDLYSTQGREWSVLHQGRPRGPESAAPFLKKFQRVYVFSPRPPELFIENIRLVGPEEVIWIPSFPDIASGVSIPMVQRAALKALSISWVCPKVYLVCGREERSAAGLILKGLGVCQGPPVWALHPGSGGLKKNWPLEHFLALAEALRREKAADPFFILGPVEKEVRPEARALIVGRGFPVLEDVELPCLAGALSRAAGYIGNDSGVTHLASCLNLPTLALFGPTDPRLWGPIGRKTVILEAGRAWQSLSVGSVLEAWRRLEASSG